MGRRGRIPPGVGPQNSQVVVLVGATGDLSRAQAVARPVLPVERRVHPRLPIIGVSLDQIDADGFRKIAREALDQFSTRKVKDADWTAFAETLDYVPIGAGADALKAAVAEGRAETGQREPAQCTISACRPMPPCRPCACWRRRASSSAPIIMEKPFGTDLKKRGRAERQAARGLFRGPDLRIDHFLGKGAGAEHPRFRFANGLFEPIWNLQLHRSCADRRSGRSGSACVPPSTRRPGRIATWWSPTCSRFSRSWRWSRRRRWAGAHQRGKEQGLSQHAADRPKACRARAIHRLPLRGRRRPRVRYRNLHRVEMRDRQLALGRRAVLPAHRQERLAEGSGSSPLRSANRPRACSRRGRASARKARTI